MICATCGVVADSSRCANCGESPVLAGKYRFDTLVGKGTVGRTYRASLLDSSGDVVAVKQLPLRGLSPEREAEIEREAVALGGLTHPRVPKHREHMITGTDQYRSLYLIQEFVEGESLADEMRTRRHTEEEVLAIAEALLPVLQYLHGKEPPVCHLDIKPANVLRSVDGGLYLMDFGSIRELIAGKHSARRVAQAYAAPEQLEGNPRTESDLFALGALMVALLSHADPPALLLPVSAPRWKAKLRLQPTMRHVLIRLLEADPDRRMHSASEARAAIRAAKRGSFLLTKEEALTRRAQDKLTSRILIAAFVVMVFGMAYAVVVEDQRREEELIRSARRVGPPPSILVDPPGALKRSALTAGLATAEETIHGCYMIALERDSQLRVVPATAVVRFEVDPSGVPGRVDVRTFRMPPDLRECVGQAIEDARFTATTGTVARVRLPIELIPPQ